MCLAGSRAGILERGTTDLLREAGVGARLDAEGIPHHGCYLSDDDLMVRINFHDLTGHAVTVYGQTEVTADLYAAQDAMGTEIHHDVEDVVIHDPTGNRLGSAFTRTGSSMRSRRGSLRAVTGSTGSAEKPSQRSGDARSSASIPLAGLGSCRGPRPPMRS